MVYRMVSATDDETMRILKDTVILFVHANPDGNDLVADWYMRNSDPAQRTLANLPRLYQKYIGHDNNRDFFASTQPETENINRVLYREWFPQILYNHHQSGPQGTVLWSPPLRDPFNYNQDPLLVLGIQTIGIALHSRLAAEGKPGATARSGGPYDGWWNGGIRNTAAFHNTIAILTEMIGSPTPMRVPLVLDRQLPNSDLTYPVPAAGMALQEVDRLFGVLQSRGARHGREDERELSLQPVRDGEELRRSRKPGHVDGSAAPVQPNRRRGSQQSGTWRWWCGCHDRRSRRRRRSRWKRRRSGRGE
jgi:hypothetical protein